MSRLGTFILFSALSFGAAAEEMLPAYNSYQSVPFVVGDGGLAADLVNYVNGKLKGKYQFKLTQVQRDGLNKTIAEPNFKGAVLFLSPAFVNDAAKTKFTWTQAVLHDANAVISQGSRKLEYTGADALKGLKFAGVKGNRYAGLEERFGKDIQREDVNEELSNIKKVVAGKADVTIMSSSTYRYLMKQMGKENAERSNLYTSSKPHAEFDRYIFVGKDNTVLAKELDTVIAGMKSDPAWKAVLVKYGID
ncbi:MAG: transporter substrate-binding domain-containing protein [Pseudomonadota bacterium]